MYCFLPFLPRALILLCRCLRSLMMNEQREEMINQGDEQIRVNGVQGWPLPGISKSQRESIQPQDTQMNEFVVEKFWLWTLTRHIPGLLARIGFPIWVALMEVRSPPGPSPLNVKYNPELHLPSSIRRVLGRMDQDVLGVFVTFQAFPQGHMQTFSEVVEIAGSLCLKNFNSLFWLCFHLTSKN